MDKFSKTISIRWADIDANFHLRHSAYYDFGAQQRMDVLEQSGLTLRIMQEQGFGPILFREECIFRKEISLSDTITITVKPVSYTHLVQRFLLIVPLAYLTKQKGFVLVCTVDR